MIYDAHPHFYKELQSLPKSIQAKFARILLYFIQDKSHPSLHTKKMKGRPIWEVRIDRSYRFLYTLEIGDNQETICYFRSIGDHSILDKE